MVLRIDFTASSLFVCAPVPLPVWTTLRYTAQTLCTLGHDIEPHLLHDRSYRLIQGARFLNACREE